MASNNNYGESMTTRLGGEDAAENPSSAATTTTATASSNGGNGQRPQPRAANGHMNGIPATVNTRASTGCVAISVESWLNQSAATSMDGVAATGTAVASGVNQVDFHASWSNTGAIPGVPMTTLQSHQSVPLANPHRQSSHAVPSPNSSDATSAIHNAARITSWDKVMELCRNRPQDAKYAGPDGWTALHHACNRRCPRLDVMEALIDAYPDALLEEEKHGRTPLHFATRFKCPVDVVRLLIHLFPDKGRLAVSKQDLEGRTPLYFAVRYDAPPGVVEILLEVDASAVLAEDQNASSPLATVWDDFAEKIDRTRKLKEILPSEDESRSLSLEEQAQLVASRLQGQDDVLERWNRANLFLQAAFGFRVDQGNQSAGEMNAGRQWRMLHATAAIKCHISLFLLACALHPEQASEIDSQDLVCPVHIMGGVDEASQLTALHLAASSRAIDETSGLVIDRLLRMHPQAARTAASDGSLPLHRAVQNRNRSHWTLDGTGNLLAAYPDAIRARDGNGLLPLHRACIAVSHHCQDESSDADAENADAVDPDSVIQNLVNEYREGASKTDNFGRLPLHIVAQHGTAWTSSIQQLYDAHQQATRARTNAHFSSNLPLHCVASNAKAEQSLITKILNLNPRGASQANGDNKLPLHLACEIGLSWEHAVSHIHAAYVDAIGEIPDTSRNWTALHMAAACPDSKDDLLINLVRLHPTNASIQDDSGRFPLHIACITGNKTWKDCLKYLFDAHPDALSTPDNRGMLPFHIVALQLSAVNATDQDGVEQRPCAFTQQSRRISRSASLEAEKEHEQEMKRAKIVGLLYDLLKANPTILQQI
eukprot:CAMPEP_0119569778 /NCGR_PEP_ID=MMETSP1352-20130426/42614_1 /TAXON_ID=265584 /ORGANISM="Stauroneis constricta, Strain CCMP1120" /LENGTH=825 /DNA_ID=CAMNT_0007619389 /DNA_START=70 /DNA_END=2547 /DNA_ORIENTATION=-